MKRPFSGVGLAVALLTLPAAAQISSTIGPQQAPAGCQIAVSISNDTDTETSLDQVCPYVVRTSSGKIVYDIPCPAFAPIPIPPGGTFKTFWDARDNFGQPVPAGAYSVTVQLPSGKEETHKLEIGSTKSGLGRQGVNRIGTKRNLYLCAPGDGGLLYLLAASLSTSPGIPSCAGKIPLAPDTLFKLSLLGSTGFGNFFGVLSKDGVSTAPGSIGDSSAV